MRELAALAETAGSTVLDGVIQRRQAPDPATFLGKGKAAELRDIVLAEGADTVICDGELAPGQRRALEDVVKVKVIDRTALILDIFAQHAQAGRARRRSSSPSCSTSCRACVGGVSRCPGRPVAGSPAVRASGRVGPGETKIELDRRRINTRIAKLKRDIAR
jgi:GTP-binding protein HflX